MFDVMCEYRDTDCSGGCGADGGDADVVVCTDHWLLTSGSIAVTSSNHQSMSQSHPQLTNTYTHAHIHTYIYTHTVFTF